RVETSPVEHYSGAVLVPWQDGTARAAHEGPFGQQQALLGSGSALAAVRRGVCRINEMHDPAVLVGHEQERGLRGTNAAVCRLPGRRGLGEELRLEILDCDLVVMAGGLLGPFPRPVLPLRGDFSVGLRDRVLGALVAAGRLLALLRLATGHLPLVLRQLLLG